MALTQSQWFDKLSSFLPRWFFEEEYYQVAHLQAFAKLLSLLDIDKDDHYSETFILQAVGDFLLAQGDERSVAKLDGEFDAQYRVRVQSLTNQSNPIAIKALVDKFLMVGECTIVEDFEAGVYLNRMEFFNRSSILIEEIYNTFSIIVDQQIHAPYSFFNNEYFMDREDFIGEAFSSQYVFDLILESVNQAKAAGTFYRVIELLES